jgi:hypothetical protein
VVHHYPDSDSARRFGAVVSGVLFGLIPIHVVAEFPVEASIPKRAYGYSSARCRAKKTDLCESSEYNGSLTQLAVQFSVDDEWQLHTARTSDQLCGTRLVVDRRVSLSFFLRLR